MPHGCSHPAPVGGTMILDEILQKNSNYSCGPEVDAGLQKGIIIFTCSDSRLVELLEPAMGLSRGDASIIKNAGIAVTDDVIRSMAVQLFNFDVQEIFVVGHTDCLVARIKTYDFTEAMKKKGVPREAIPSGDLRGWLCAASTERERVRESVEGIRKSPLIPRDVLIHGLLMDSRTGALDVVVKGHPASAVMTSAAAGAGAAGAESRSTSIFDRPSEWAKTKVQEAKEEARSTASAIDSTLQWAKESVKEVKDGASRAGHDARQALQNRGGLPGLLNQPAQALNNAADEIRQAATFDWSLSHDSSYQPDADAFGASSAIDRAQERARGWYEKGADVLSQAASMAPQTQKIDGHGGGLKEAAGAGDAALERFEVWLEDMGVFNDEVKKEIKRMTGVTVDDITALKKAITSTRSPQEAQRIKKQLQALGASAIIRRVKKLLK